MSKRMNKRTEKQFIENYKEKILTPENVRIKNANCSSKCMADVQYEKDGVLWLVEAKTSVSSDRNNAVHKIFGELLKLTGFESPSKTVKYGLLLNEKEFFNNQFKSIAAEKLLAFGKLIPVDAVFIFDGEKCEQLTWEEFIK